ncbi:TIGR04076 family protein [Chloroflexota bacterium]
MSERYEVAVKIISQKGTCDNGHKVGEEWVLKTKTPEGICLGAFNALYPAARTFMFGGAHPWNADKDVTTIACPDADNPVVFEIRRIRK